MGKRKMGISRISLFPDWDRKKPEKIKMEKTRVLSIFGTRPEAVKMASVVKELESHTQIQSLICATAQHREMLDQVLKLFAIQPNFDLNLMQTNQGLAELTASLFHSLDPVLQKVKPDWVLVQGDTTTVMAAAICAYYHHIKVGHVEAGLRTRDKYAPFPEEINRRIAGAVADLHFAPTQHSRQNLLKEGVPDLRIKVTGNPVIDALQQIIHLPMPDEIKSLLTKKEILNGERMLITITAHRRESFGKPFEEICRGLKKIAEAYSDRVVMVYPVHLNPNVKEPVNRILGDVANITLIDPVEYLSLIHLLKQSKLVLTDSGGIQEEATGLGIPTLVLRDVTERPEGVEAGVLKLVGTDSERIFQEVQQMLDYDAVYQRMAHAANPFGDGHAAERIVQAILDYQEPTPQPGN
jgi:UDP-N-acetylglucosamine 2-epimerase (non-hydrolysing)